MHSPLALSAVVSAALVLPLRAQDALAEYDVTFTATWSSTTHPGAFPAGAHFSALVGATHGASVSFWQPGALASPGIESMAETGATALLAGEVNAAIAAGTAGELILGPGIDTPGATTVALTLTEEHDLVTLVTMIAPSPDWFIGVHDVDLFVDCDWVASKTVELYAYDAGTDSGATFTAPNLDTDPPEPIALMTGGPFTGAVPLGTFTFQRKAAVQPYGCGINPDGSLTYQAVPRVGQTWDLAVHDPTASMPFGSIPVVTASAFAVPTFPCGCAILQPGLGLGGPVGEILLPLPALTVVGTAWTGAPVDIPFLIPPAPTLAGKTAIVQGGLIDPLTLKIGLTQGMRVWIGE